MLCDVHTGRRHRDAMLASVGGAAAPRGESSSAAAADDAHRGAGGAGVGGNASSDGYMVFEHDD